VGRFGLRMVLEWSSGSRPHPEGVAGV
jgi:hypothetical protein